MTFAHLANFAHLADALLNRHELMVAGHAHRLSEVEFYWHSPAHPDPFVHAHPLQLTGRRWYFHRVGMRNHAPSNDAPGGYRGGSFKGVDLTCGDGRHYGGVLIRAIEPIHAPGQLIEGPSLVVDHLLRTTGHASVAALDQASAGLAADDPANLLHLRPTPRLPPRPVVWSVRVGLTLRRRLGDVPTQVRFLLAPYRAVAEPARLTKGRVHIAIAQHALGQDADRIAEMLQTRRAVVEHWLRAIQTQAAQPPTDWAAWLEQPLTPLRLCRLAGAWQSSCGRHPGAWQSGWQT
jgi:hypothetical protein